MTARKPAETGPAQGTEPVQDTNRFAPQPDPEPAPVSALNVYQRIQKAAAAIDRMEWTKDMANSQYKSIPIDQMRRGVRKACIAAGLVHVGPLDIELSREMKDGRTWHFYAKCIWRYVNADNPAEYVDYPSVGEAMDNGDKGTGKAVTNALKNHYKAMWDIGEQGRDDIDSYTNEDIAAEADRIAKRRAAELPQAKPPEDEALAPMRRRVAQCMATAPETVKTYLDRYGLINGWTEETLAACLKECGAGA